MSGKQLLSASLIFILFYISYQFLGYKFGLIKQVPNPVQTKSDFTENPNPDILKENEFIPDPNLGDQLEMDSTLQDSASRVPTPDESPAKEKEPEIAPQQITLRNDFMEVVLDNRGGVIRTVTLSHFFESVKNLDKVVLVAPFANAPGEITFSDNLSTAKRLFKVTEVSEKEVRFDTTVQGRTVTKTYSLDDQYALRFDMNITGSGDQNFTMVLAEGLEPLGDKAPPKKSFFSFLSAGSSAPKLMEIAWSENGSHNSKPATKYKNSQYQNILEEDQMLLWAGIKDTYFCNVFIPETPFRNISIKNNFLPQSNGEPAAIPVVSVSGTDQIKGVFYLGPLNESDLMVVNPNLANLVNYGYTGKLTKWMFIALEKINYYVGNWGWSIVLLTIVIRLILFPLTAPSIKSGYKMRKLQPKLEAIKKKFPGTDLESKQKLSQETWKLYKTEKVNPFSSCITILPQMPIFIAYFSLLRTSISLRQSGWIFWINDLSLKDPTFILPILWGASMYVSQTMTPMPGDPSQQKMMKYMPVMMTLLFISMPSGLVLYMVTSNLFQLFQTVLFKWRYEKA